MAGNFISKEDQRRNLMNCWLKWTTYIFILIVRSKVMYSYGPPHKAEQKQDDQLEHTYSSYVRIRDIALKTCQRR